MTIDLLLLALVAIPVTLSEARYALIPDWTIRTLMAGALVSHAARSSAVPVVASASLGLGIPLLVRALIPGGIGWGDVKLSLALFLLLGPTHGLIGLLVACLIALGGFGVAVALEGFSLSGDAGLPFGPSMIAGALVSVTMEISI